MMVYGVFKNEGNGHSLCLHAYEDEADAKEFVERYKQYQDLFIGGIMVTLKKKETADVSWIPLWKM